MPSEATKLTSMEQAMMWERMSGERLSDAERNHVMDGGEFIPPHLRKPKATVMRTIWFWQVSRYMDEGWTINQERISFRPSSWPGALLDTLRPLAIRSETNG